MALQPGSNPTAARSSGGISSRRAASNPAFREKLRQMGLGLAPLVRLTTGEIHPAFPKTLLSFWLLTDAELESLATFYHQRTPSRWTRQYPCPITWQSDLPIEEKRRKIGRFIGLRGCESPIVAQHRRLSRREGGESSTGSGSGSGSTSEEQLLRESLEEGEIWEDQNEDAEMTTAEAMADMTEEDILEVARRARIAEAEEEQELWRRKLPWYQ